MRTANLAAAQDRLTDPMRDVGGQLDRAFKPVIMAIKRMAWDALDSSLETALNAERRWQRDAGRTEDFLEGVSAFVEKRKPAFKGR